MSTEISGESRDSTVETLLRQSVDDLIHYLGRHWLDGTVPDSESVIAFVKQLIEPKLLAEMALLRAELEMMRRSQAP